MKLRFMLQRVLGGGGRGPVRRTLAERLTDWGEWKSGGWQRHGRQSRTDWVSEGPRKVGR